MKKLFISTLFIVGAGSQLMADQGIEIANAWKAQGDLRAGYVEYDYNNPPSSTSAGKTDSKGIYIAPKISIISPTYNNLSLKATVAGVTDF